MKRASIILFLPIILVVTSAYSQDDDGAASTNASVQSEAGGLQIDEQTDDERIKLLLSVASVYSDEGDFQSAMDAYERVLVIDPKNRQARYIISNVYLSTKQYAKAVATLESLIEEYPDDYQLKNNLAWLYATAEDPAYRNGDKAIKLAQEAMVLAPNDHHVWSTLAEAYYVSGKYEKANRAATQMASLAARYGKGITQELVDSYNEQIRKCKRAWESEKALKGQEDSDEEPDVDATETVQLPSESN